MSVSTITNNLNLLLIDTSVITANNPYVVYVSSVSVPGRIATIRDANGYLSTPNSIIVSSTKDVYFNSNISSISITQPFGFISLSSRDKNVWNVINTFAFPDPLGVSYVSSLYVRDGVTSANIATEYVSTPYVYANSISSLSIQTINSSSISVYASNIITGNLSVVNSISASFGVSTSVLSTHNLYASNATVASLSSINTLSQNTYTTLLESLNINTSNITTSNLATSNITAVSITTSNFSTVSIASSNISTLNFNASNISTVYIAASNIFTFSVATSNISTTNLNASNISTVSIVTSNISTTNLNASNISTVNLNTSNISTINLNASNISTVNLNAFSILTQQLNSRTVSTVNIAASNISTVNLYSHTISTVNLSASNISTVTIAASNISTVTIAASNISTINLSAYNILTQQLDSRTVSTVNLAASNISTVLTQTNSMTTSSIRLFSGTVAGFISASANGTELLYNNSAIGSWTPTATSGLNMANYSISNVNNLIFANGGNLATLNFDGTRLVCTSNFNMNVNGYVGGILYTNIIQANSLNYITLYNDLNLNNYSIYGVNSLTTGTINANTINASNILNLTLNTLNISTSNISSFFYGGIEKYNYISTTGLESTVRGLGAFGYISSLQLQSTVRGLGTFGYLSTNTVPSTITGLGTFGFISSLSLQSTIKGLGNTYLSTNTVPSTITGLGTFGYISSLSLQSTIAGLGTFNYISSLNISTGNLFAYDISSVNVTICTLNANVIKMKDVNANIQFYRSTNQLIPESFMGVDDSIGFVIVSLSTINIIAYQDNINISSQKVFIDSEVFNVNNLAVISSISTNYIESSNISTIQLNGDTINVNNITVSNVISGNTVQTQLFSNMATNLTIPQLYVDNYGGCNINLDTSFIEITNRAVSRPFYTINNFNLYKVTISVYGGLTSVTPTGTIDTYFTFSNVGGIGTGLGLDVNSGNPYTIEYNTSNLLRYTYTDIYDLNELTNSCNYKIRIFMKTAYITNLNNYTATILYEPVFSNY